MQPAELVLRAMDGDSEAWNLIVKGNRNYMLAVAAYRGFSHVAEDITNETFLLGFQSIATLRDPKRLRNWLTGIELNLIKRYRMRQSREQRWREQGEPDENRAVDPLPRPDEQLMETDQKERLMAAVQSLPLRQRQVVTLRHCKDYDLEEIATELGTTVNAVKCSLGRGLEKLRKMAGK